MESNLGLIIFVKLFVDLTSLDPGNNSNQSVLAPCDSGVWLLYGWWQRGHPATASELIVNSRAACCCSLARLYFFISYSHGPGRPRGCQSTLIFIITWNLSGLNGSTAVRGSLSSVTTPSVSRQGNLQMYEMFYCLSDLVTHLAHCSTHSLPIVQGSSPLPLPPFIVTVWGMF